MDDQENKEDTDKTEEEMPHLQGKSAANAQVNPKIWLVLLAVPIVFSMVNSMIPLREKPPPEPVRETANPAISRAVTRLDVAGGFSPRAGTAEGRKDVLDFKSRGVLDKKNQPACRFPEWIGKKAEGKILSGLKKMKTPFRMLPPGSMMTMDHVPSRINLEVDESGIIIKVWCG